MGLEIFSWAIWENLINKKFFNEYKVVKVNESFGYRSKWTAWL